MKISVVNCSPLFSSLATSGDELELVVEACRQQVFYHFSLAWNLGNWEVQTAQDPSTAEGWRVCIFDSGAQANAEGWHTMGPDGRPYAAVFMATIPGLRLYDAPEALSPVISHEICEALGDPGVNNYVDDGTTFHAEEACDAVEDEAYPIQILRNDGRLVDVYVSNFLMPAWFGGPRYEDVGGQYDWMGTRSAPFERSPGGYEELRAADGTPRQVFGPRYADWRRVKKQFAGSRSARRRLPHAA